MPEYSVTCIGSDHGGDCYEYQPILAVNDEGGVRIGQVTVALTSTALASTGLDRPETVNSVLLMYGLSRIEGILRSGTDPQSMFDPGTNSARWFIRSSDVESVFLESDFHSKECAYRLEEGRDLYCAAAARNDESRVGTSGARVIAPTSRPICEACGVPDQRVVCTEFSHPQVIGVATNATSTRVLGRTMCNAGSSQISAPQRCKPGENSCWRRTFSVRRGRASTSQSPLRLPEALDFLDATWQMSGRGSLVRPTTSSDAAGLAAECATPEEFESRMSDVADALDRIQVADTLVEAAGATNEQGALNRFRAVLLSFDGIDAAIVNTQVQILQKIRGLRHTQGHSGAARDRPRILRELGVPESGYSPRDALTMIKNAAANAVLELRNEIRRVTSTD